MYLAQWWATGASLMDILHSQLPGHLDVRIPPLSQKTADPSMFRELYDFLCLCPCPLCNELEYPGSSYQLSIECPLFEPRCLLM